MRHWTVANKRPVAAKLVALMQTHLGYLLLLFSAVACAQDAAVIGDVTSPDVTVRGAVIVGSTGTSIVSGSQISAGESNADIHLKRTGELQVCKRSSITVTSSTRGREMLIALNSGSLETHYSLASASDSIITPDFRLLLTGPGAFHFAIGTLPQGGLCVRSLPGNASSLNVNEQFGDGAHQVKPGEQVTFHNGKVDDLTPDAADCGCPQPIKVVEQKEAAPGLGFPEQQSKTAEQEVAAGRPAPVGPALVVPAGQAAKPGQTFTQIDAPVVYRAEDVPPSQPSVARNVLPPVQPPVPTPSAQPPSKPMQKRKWYQRFGNALASIFGSPDKAK